MAEKGLGWIVEKRNQPIDKQAWVCPNCRARYKYEIWLIWASNKIELPKCCPNCGKRLIGG